MANNKRIELILKNASALDLKVKKLSWGELYYDRLVDFRISINLFGEIVTGTGIDCNEDMAFLKAFSEAVERSYCKKLNLRSHGVSAHWSKEEAINCSKNELIERDIFLCHFLTGTAARRIQNDEVIRLNSILSEKSGRLKVYELTMLNGRHVILAVGEKGHIGSVIGVAANKKYELAVEKSILECLSRLDFELNNTENLLVREHLVDPIDHYNYHLMNRSLQDTDFIKKSSFSKSVSESDQGLEFSWEQIGNLGELIKELEIYVIKGSSSDLQATYYGELSPSVVNFSRLSNFLGQAVNFDGVEKLAHPIG